MILKWYYDFEIHLMLVINAKYLTHPDQTESKSFAIFKI
jgi:hypothetical protein